MWPESLSLHQLSVWAPFFTTEKIPELLNRSMTGAAQAAEQSALFPLFRPCAGRGKEAKREGPPVNHQSSNKFIDSCWIIGIFYNEVMYIDAKEK